MAISPFWYEHSVCSHTPPVSLNERMRGTRMIHHRPKQGLCKIQPGWKQGWRHLYVWKATASPGQVGNTLRRLPPDRPKAFAAAIWLQYVAMMLRPFLAGWRWKGYGTWKRKQKWMAACWNERSRKLWLSLYVCFCGRNGAVLHRGCTFKPDIDQKSAEMISQRLARLKITGTLCPMAFFSGGCCVLSHLLFDRLNLTSRTHTHISIYICIFIFISHTNVINSYKYKYIIYEIWKQIWSETHRYDSLYEDAVRRRERHLESVRAAKLRLWKPKKHIFTWNFGSDSPMATMILMSHWAKSWRKLRWRLCFFFVFCWAWGCRLRMIVHMIRVKGGHFGDIAEALPPGVTFQPDIGMDRETSRPSLETREAGARELQPIFFCKESQRRDRKLVEEVLFVFVNAATGFTYFLALFDMPVKQLPGMRTLSIVWPTRGAIPTACSLPAFVVLWC